MCIFAWGGALFISTSWRSKKGNKQMSESKGSCQNTKKPHMKLPMLKLTLQTFHANEHFFLISDHCSALFKAYRFAHACICFSMARSRNLADFAHEISSPKVDK
jgi:hypothetical protein